MSATLGGFTAPFAAAGVLIVFATASLLVLWFESPNHPRWRTWVLRWNRRLTGRPTFSWFDGTVVTVAAASGFTIGVATFAALGGYGCIASGPPDLITLYTSGHVFLSGGDPFTITACGVGGNPVPAGIASVLLDALGSLGGPVGVLLVWGAVAVAVVPLLWALGEDRRAVAVAFVLASAIYFPIIAVQLDGDTLALVPLTVLLVVYLSRRGWIVAASIGGFLSTGRFPSLFPVLAASGRAGPKRWLAPVAALVVFGAITIATFSVYGTQFLNVVFFSQFARGELALNYWGVLFGLNLVSPSHLVTLVQAALTLVLVGACWRWARSELGAIAIVLTGTLLLTQVLPFTELVFLLPVALMGRRARWWLWGIGTVAMANYLLVWPSLQAASVPAYALDLLLTALLIGLLVDLLRRELVLPGTPAVGAALPSS